jgi:hypothetical protein
MSTNAILEELVGIKARLERLEQKSQEPRWRKVVGSIKPNEFTREAARLGAEWRKTENERR